VKRSITLTRDTVGQLFVQRCFYLFVVLLAHIAVAPLLYTSPRGALVTNLIDTFIILAAVAAVGRSSWSFVAVLVLAIPAAIFRWLSVDWQESSFLEVSFRLHAGVYLIAIGLLLRYVFDREVMNADRLWGAAAAYLMIGIFWSFIYAIIDHANPRSFSVRGDIVLLDFSDLIYFSMSTVTTTGFGDIVPIERAARSAAVVEAIIGQLFIAILIAKLVGVYPPGLRRTEVGGS
jgi:hypothetical protein